MLIVVEAATQTAAFQVIVGLGWVFPSVSNEFTMKVWVVFTKEGDMIIWVHGAVQEPSIETPEVAVPRLVPVTKQAEGSGVAGANV